MFVVMKNKEAFTSLIFLITKFSRFPLKDKFMFEYINLRFFVQNQITIFFNARSES